LTTTPRLSVDTSVAVPLLVASHERHSAVARWASEQSLSLAGHALAETYSVLTRLPGDARVAPADAVVLIEANFSAALVLSVQSAQGAHRELASNGIAGGATYDGLVALASREHGAILVTRDARARSTYERLGLAVEVLTGDELPG
jgi:toxin FitB